MVTLIGRYLITYPVPEILIFNQGGGMAQLQYCVNPSKVQADTSATPQAHPPLKTTTSPTTIRIDRFGSHIVDLVTSCRAPNNWTYIPRPHPQSPQDHQT